MEFDQQIRRQKMTSETWPALQEHFDASSLFREAGNFCSLFSAPPQHDDLSDVLYHDVIQKVIARRRVR